MERVDPAEAKGTEPRRVERLSANRYARPTAQGNRHAAAVGELTPRGMDEQRRLVRASLLMRGT